MTTYFVLSRGVTESHLLSPNHMAAGIEMMRSPNLQRQTSHHGSFAAVVLGMLQASKRCTNIPTNCEFLFEIVYTSRDIQSNL